MTPATAPPERIIGDHVAEDIAPIIARHTPGTNLMLVCDDATWEALGEKVAARHQLPHHSLGKHAKAEKKHALTLIDKAKMADGFIAVGAGTINDITKYAATELKKPYITLATAASMNGYTSATASLEENGIKHSYAAAPPRAVVADLTVITHAPKRLTRAGLGDTLARSTVEADCLLSHHILGTPYPKEAFDCLRAHEPMLINESMKLVDNDPAYMRCLVEALLDAGDWMARTGSSAVASQGEHMIAHTAEMLYEPELRYVFHGELVGIATIALSHLQQKTLLGAVNVKPLPFDEARFSRLFSKKRGPQLASAYGKKLLSEKAAADINQRLAESWPAIRAQISKIMKSPLTLERVFMQANLPVLPKDIKLDNDHFASAISYAHLTRDRFGFLDLAAMVGKRI